MERNLRSRKKTCLEKSSKANEEDLPNDNPTSEILNDDCLLHIFEYLPISDRIRLERVSKRWCAVSRMSWKSFRTLNFTSRLWGHDTTINRKAMKDVLTLCGEFLKVWDMSQKSVKTSEKIYVQSLLKFCPNLISVDFTLVKVGVPLISALVQYCQNIVILNLGKITISVPEWFRNGTVLSTYANLQVLNIESINEYCSFLDVTFSGDWIQFQDNSTITELRLDYCAGLENSNIAAVVPKLSNLYTLSLRGSLETWIIPWDIYFITQSNIKVLDISSNSQCVDNYFLTKIACVCEKLTSLYIGDNLAITDKGLNAAIFSSNLEYLNIDELNVKGSCLTNLPELKKLSCQYCVHLQSKYFEDVFKISERLESIDLKGVRNSYGIIKIAVESIKSRKNNSPLVIYADNSYSDTQVPDNLKLIKLDDNDDDNEDSIPLFE